MAKKKAQGYKLTNEARKRLNKYLTAIRQGITNVCEIHTHETAPSMSQADFEVGYIDTLLGQTATAVSVTMRSLVDAIAEQKETELNKVLHSNSTPEKAQEGKK